MKRLSNRRTMLVAAGTMAVAAVAGTVAAQSPDIRGTVTFEGGAKIPQGQIELVLEDPAVDGRARLDAAKTRVISDGGSTTITFAVPLPAGRAASPSQQIVARLERADGWLLARGSARIETGAPVDVTLYTVMY